MKALTSGATQRRCLVKDAMDDEARDDMGDAVDDFVLGGCLRPTFTEQAKFGDDGLVGEAS
jgi:hypothetical protein